MTFTATLSPALASTAILRRSFRRFRGLALVQGIAALGMLPLLYYVPRSAGVRTVLLLLLALYVLRKVSQFRHALRGVKQLRMEEQFLRYSHDPAQLRRCLTESGHLWARSYVLRGLRAITAAPTPDLLIGERRQRAYLHYHTAFGHLRPAKTDYDLGLLALLLLVLLVASRLPLDLGAVLFQTGLLGAGLALGAELSQAILQRSTYRTFEAFAHALSEWTMTERFEAVLRQAHRRPYHHTLHYHARPWFVPPPPLPLQSADRPVPVDLDEGSYPLLADASS